MLKLKLFILTFPIREFIFRHFYKIRFYKQHKKANKDNIPRGDFCYDEKICPYFRGLNYRFKNDEFNAWCVYKNDNDLSLLWDMCKMCGENEEQQ
jgi:hypothetical protein